MKKIVILGRPNVGKSSFLNRLLGKNIAITAREEGVTRDVRYFDIIWNGKAFKICDTGGLDFSKDNSNHYQKNINQLVEQELIQSHKILFMVDFNFPEHPLDLDINQWLKPFQHKVMLLINKVDNFERQQDLHAFYTYGVSPFYPVSAIQGNGIGDVLDDITVDLLHQDDDHIDESIRVSLIGKPNVGKSSLYNAIFNQNKALVDDVMGTTRDINESRYMVDNEWVTFMDTAGIRKRRKITDTIEYFSIVRTEKAIESSNVVLFMVDVQDLLADQDKKILNHIFKLSKNMVVFVNKWDTQVKSDQTRNDIIGMLQYQVPQLKYYPIIMGSAKEKHNIQSVLRVIKGVHEASQHRIPTGELNRFLEHFFEINHPPSKKGKQFKVYYATQVSACPPQFVFKVNDKRLLSQSFLRNFERAFREFFPNSTGVGMKFEFRSKNSV